MTRFSAPYSAVRAICSLGARPSGRALGATFVVLMILMTGCGSTTSGSTVDSTSSAELSVTTATSISTGGAAMAGVGPSASFVTSVTDKNG